jgi:hypothetical protein
MPGCPLRAQIGPLKKFRNGAMESRKSLVVGARVMWLDPSFGSVALLLRSGRLWASGVDAPSAFMAGRLWPVDAPIRAFGPSGDPEDDDETLGIVDQVDHAQIADAQAPEVGPRELRRACWTRLDREGEDRATQPRGIARRKASELTLGRRR